MLDHGEQGQAGTRIPTGHDLPGVFPPSLGVLRRANHRGTTHHRAAQAPKIPFAPVVTASCPFCLSDVFGNWPTQKFCNDLQFTH